MSSKHLRHPNFTFSESIPVQTRFSDYDTFGHVNNNAYMAIFDIGKTHFFRQVTGRQANPIALGAVIVNINVDFLEPALIDEPIAVQTAVETVSHNSFTLYQRIVNPTDGHIKAQATSVLAGFDPRTQTGAPLRPDLLECLSDKVINA